MRDSVNIDRAANNGVKSNAWARRLTRCCLDTTVGLYEGLGRNVTVLESASVYFYSFEFVCRNEESGKTKRLVAKRTRPLLSRHCPARDRRGRGEPVSTKVALRSP